MKIDFRCASFRVHPLTRRFINELYLRLICFQINHSACPWNPRPFRYLRVYQFAVCSIWGWPKGWTKPRPLPFLFYDRHNLENHYEAMSNRKTGSDDLNLNIKVMFFTECDVKETIAYVVRYIHTHARMHIILSILT